MEKFDELEKDLFGRIVDYFARAEERELAELKAPGGNLDYVTRVEKNLKAFNSIKRKVENTLF